MPVLLIRHMAIYIRIVKKNVRSQNDYIFYIFTVSLHEKAETSKKMIQHKRKQKRDENMRKREERMKELEDIESEISRLEVKRSICYR